MGSINDFPEVKISGNKGLFIKPSILLVLEGALRAFVVDLKSLKIMIPKSLLAEDLVSVIWLLDLGSVR